MKPRRLQAWFGWASLILLALLCAVVAVLQYRWIGGISEADRERMQSQLQERLVQLRRDFNDQVLPVAAALQPSPDLIERSGRETAYAYQYSNWKEKHAPLFRRIGLAVPGDSGLAFYAMDLATGRLTPADWPADWNAMRERLAARWNGGPAPGPRTTDYALLEMPRFGQPGAGRPGEQEWLILELDLSYIRSTLIPEVLARHLGEAGALNYDAEVAPDQSPDTLIYPAGANLAKIGHDGDASILLLDNAGGFGRRGGPPPEPGPRGDGGRGRGFEEGRGPQPRAMVGSAPWLLSVRHKAGSLEALVQQARMRNLAVSGGLLLLLVATATMLVRSTGEARRLAEMQMEFVAGVSHELRTPLTVIRTAAFNLRGKMSHMPEHVERYGALIQDETEKLGALVEQVLNFARTRAGAVIRRREPVQVDRLIESSLESTRRTAALNGVVLDCRLESGLPPVLVDELAMRHALQNLIQNALKYGTEGSNWIGISAAAVDGQVEIRVSDRGPGIPRDERDRIFDPFFRGRHAVSDQVHGTGLGLDIVRKIVEAHGGKIRVESDPGKLTEFIVSVPAAGDDAAEAFE